MSLGLVKKLLQQRRRTGDIRPRHHRSGRKPRILEAHRRQLRQLVDRKPNLTLEELRDALVLRCTPQAIHSALAALGLTYKKRCVPPSKAGRTSRPAWSASVRPVPPWPLGNTTMICSIRLDGTTACLTIEAATDTDVFRAYVREILCSTLHPGDVVVMDNLSPHKNDRTLALIESTGACVEFLPAYSPDLNPIEMMWSKVKALLRAA